MNLYCDESGGVGAGVMTLAAVSLDPDAAQTVLQRMRDVLGLPGELKGSRIDLPTRAFLIEMLLAHGAQAIIATARVANFQRDAAGKMPEDIHIYAALLETVIEAWLPRSGGCIDVHIDDGRYDARLNGLLRADVQATLGQWGRASLQDSDRSPGVQIADVIANSFFQIGTGGSRAHRISALFAPAIASGAITLRPVNTLR